MPRRSVSKDLKERIPILRYELCYSVKDICKILGIQKTAVYKVLEYHRKHGSVVNPDADPSLVRRPRILSSTHTSFIRELLEKDKELYLDEVLDQLQDTFGIKISITTLWRTLRRLRFSHKQSSPKAIERDSERRSVYMNDIAEIAPNPEMLMFTDESAKDERTSSRRYGWSPYGKRCVTRSYFVRGRRFSILPVLSLDGIIAHDIIEGSVTSEIFLRFLREMVVSNCFPHIYLTHNQLDSSYQPISWPSQCLGSG